MIRQRDKEGRLDSKVGVTEKRRQSSWKAWTIFDNTYLLEYKTNRLLQKSKFPIKETYLCRINYKKG